jgi:hypothetical protein
MEVNDLGDGAELSLVPEDIDGLYDYIPDTQSMALGSGEQQLAGTKAAVEMLMNPANQQLLMQSGVKIKIQDLLIDYLEDLGKSDASKYFDETVQQQPQLAQPAVGLQQGIAPVSPDSGMQNGIPALPPEQGLQPMAGSEGMQIPQGF